MPKILVSRFRICVLLAIACPISSTVAADAEPISVGQSLTLHSRVLNEDRQLLIYLPDGYASSSAAYPVVYLLDAETHGLHAASSSRLLALLGAMPKVIVVGIVNSDRPRDMTPRPATPEKDFPSGGGAEAFHSFLVGELKPFVEKRYRTSPFSVLAGTSLSGLFVVDSFVAHPSGFNAYIAASPSLWWDKRAVVRRAGSPPREPLRRNTFLFVSLCDEDSKELQESTGQFESAINAASRARLQAAFIRIPDETHNSSPLKSFYEGFKWLYEGWRAAAPADLAALKQHYELLSEKYGYPISVPESEVNALGYSLLFSERKVQAIPVFRLNVDSYPASANAWDSLGDAYKGNGQLELASEAYEKGCELGTLSRDASAPSICANMNAVKKLLAEKAVPPR
jgi:uncharacterized protein